MRTRVLSTRTGCRLLDTSERSILGGLLKDWGDKIEWSAGHDTPPARRAYAVAAAIYKAGLLKTTGMTAGAASGLLGPGPLPRKSKQVGGDDFSHGDNMPRGLAYKLPSYITAAYAEPEGGDPADRRSPILTWRDLLVRGVEVSTFIACFPLAVSDSIMCFRIAQIIHAHDAMTAATRTTPLAAAKTSTHARTVQSSRGGGREQSTALGPRSVGSSGSATRVGSCAGSATTTPARPQQLSGGGASARAPVSEI